MEELQLLMGNNIEPIKTLGQGAFGRVYLSYHNELGIIAAKVMKIEKFDAREWDAAGALNQQFESDVVILMEYANAKSLDSIVKDKTQYLTSATYRALAKQILEGIRMVHAARLIHRDIKPENIMMHSANGIIKVKLADFGLAKVVQNTLLGVSSYGTPLNMAPELVLRDVPATNKVDMYSVGTVLYQLATHDYPINVNSVPELQKKFAAGPIKRPASMLDGMQWDFLSKLLEFDPNKRFSAKQALQHPYFTSLAEITPEIRQITQNAVKIRNSQQKVVTEYDKNETFTVPTTEIRKFIKTDPEAEEQTILQQRTQQQAPIYPGQQQTQTVRQQIRPPSPMYNNLNQLQQQSKDPYIQSSTRFGTQFVLNPVQYQQRYQLYNIPPPANILPSANNLPPANILPQNQIQPQQQYNQQYNQYSTPLPIAPPTYAASQQPGNAPSQFIPQQPSIQKYQQQLNTHQQILINPGIQNSDTEPLKQTMQQNIGLNINQQQQQQYTQIQSHNQNLQNTTNNQFPLNLPNNQIPQNNPNNQFNPNSQYIQNPQGNFRLPSPNIQLPPPPGINNKLPFGPHNALNYQQNQKMNINNQQNNQRPSSAQLQRPTNEYSQLAVQQSQNTNQTRTERSYLNRKPPQIVQQDLRQALHNQQKNAIIDGLQQSGSQPILRSLNKQTIQQIPPHNTLQLSRLNSAPSVIITTDVQSIECPFCNQQSNTEQISNHISTHSEGKQMLYIQTQTLLPLIKLNDQGIYYFDKKDSIECPFCNKEQLMLHFHVEIRHKDQNEIFQKLLKHHKQLEQLQNNNKLQIKQLNEVENQKQYNSQSDQALIQCEICNKEIPFNQYQAHQDDHTTQIQRINDERKQKQDEDERKKKEEEASVLMIQQLEKEKKEKERLRKLQEDNDRKTAERLLQEEIDRVQRQEKQLLTEDKVLCIFCQTGILGTQILNHIHINHPNNEDLYNNMMNITRIILNRTETNYFGQISIRRGKVVQCPYCTAQLDASDLENHINRQHNDQKQQQYNVLFHNCDLTMKLIEKHKLEDEQRRKALEEEQRRKSLEEEQRRKSLEEEQNRKALEEEEKRKTLEEEEKRKTLKVEQNRKALEEEQRRKSLEEEQRRKSLEEEKNRKALEEEQNRKTLEEEQRRKSLEEEYRKKSLEEDQKIKLEEKQKIKQIEEEQKRKALEEEKRRKSLEEEQRRIHVEIEQINKQQEKEIGNRTVQCSRCQKKLFLSSLQMHIQQYGQGYNRYYKETKAIFEANIKQKLDPIDIYIECPYCNDRPELKQIEKHIQKNHMNKNQFQQYQEIMIHHDNVRNQKQEILYKYFEIKESLQNHLYQLENQLSIINSDNKQENKQQYNQDDYLNYDLSHLNELLLQLNKQENDEINNQKVSCPFCEINPKLFQLQEHILEIHKKNHLNYYNNILTIFEVQQQQQFTLMDVNIQCPICNIMPQLKKIEEHIQQIHQQKDLKNYLSLIFHHEKVSKSIQIIKNKYNEQRKYIINRIKELRNVGEKKEEVSQIERKEMKIENKQQNEDSDGQQDEDNNDQFVQCHLCPKQIHLSQIINHIITHKEEGQIFLNKVQSVVGAQQLNNKLAIFCPFCQVSWDISYMLEHISFRHQQFLNLFNSISNLLKSNKKVTQQIQSHSSSPPLPQPPISSMKQIQQEQQPQQQQLIKLMPKQILQQNSTPQIPRILTLILPKDITLDHFKIRGIENVYFPKEWIVKLDKSEHTMVVFDHEINSGVWEFTVKGGNLQNWFGIGIINAKQTQIPHPYLFNKQDRNNTVCYVRDTIYIRGLPQDDSGNTEIRSDEQVTAVVDLKSNPPMFYIVVNNTIQPFCVVNIPDKVQFMLFFSTKDSVWEFVSLKELDHGINITRINSNKRFNYQ